MNESNPTPIDEIQRLAHYRQKHWDAFLKNGLPTRKHEGFKYAELAFLNQKKYSSAKEIDANTLPAKARTQSNLIDVIKEKRISSEESILLVSINGYFNESLSDLRALPKNVIVCNIREAIKRFPDLSMDNIDAQKYPFASLNGYPFSEGIALILPDHCEINVPVHFLSLAVDEDDWIAHTHHLFKLGKHCKLILIEEYASTTQCDYMMNVATTMLIGAETELEYYKIQNENKHAVHTAYTSIQQHENSRVSLINLSKGAHFSRDDLIIQLQERGADCHTSGFYHLQEDNQYIAHHVDIQHRAPHTQSDMLYKGIIENNARAVFDGRLFVEKEAQKIFAYQANHHLLLSREAEAYSKPQLEIYADDIKCKHGATTGQLDQDALFYLRSRGISLEDAVNVLLKGFAEEIMQRITHAGIKMRAEE